MRIGVDASRAFIDKKTGTETYSYQLITHLMNLPEAQSHVWILYVRPNFQFSIYNFQSNSNFKIQIINLPYLWTQIGLAARTWIDKLDVLWVPAHTLPVIRNPFVKTVVTIHGIEYEWLPAFENPLQRWYLPISTQYAVRSAQKIVAVSQFTKKQLVQRLWADPEKISVVYEGVDDSIVNNQSSIVNDSKKYILFIGTVQPRKNLVRLINVYSKLEISNLKLVICGKLGWGYQEVLDAIDRSNRKQDIVIKGYVNDTERDSLLANASVYVQPSITEGFGLPILEAFAAGVAVVSSNGGALPEVVGDAGLLFDPLSLQDMADKISRVLKDDSLRKRLIAKGKTRIKSFSWQKATKQTYNIITNL